MLFADSVTAAVHWDEMWIKHIRNAVPANWESLGNPAIGATIDLYIALIPDLESALVDALSEISNPRHPRHVHLATPFARLFTFVDPFQIWRISYKGTSCRSCQPAPRNCRSRPCLACTPRHTIFLHLGYPRRLLADGHGRARVPGKPTPRRVISTLLEFEDEQHDNRHGRYALPAVLHSRIRAVAPTTYFPFTRGVQQTPHVRPFGGAATHAQAASGDIVTARQVPGITPSLLR